MDNESIVQAEYAAARQEGRQPRCPYCQADLIIQRITKRETFWIWDGERFERRMSDDISAPRCRICKTIDWRFIDNDLVKLCDPVTLFALTEEDAQIMAEQMGIAPLNRDSLERVRKYVDAGLDNWSDVLEAAIREAVGA